MYLTFNRRDGDHVAFTSGSDPDTPPAALKSLGKYPDLLQNERIRLHLLHLANVGGIQDPNLRYLLARALYHGSFISQSETIGAFPRDWTKSAELAEQVTQLLWPHPNAKTKQIRSHDEQVLAMKAAEQLGFQYLRGEGVVQNTDTAYTWFMRAKEVDNGLSEEAPLTERSYRAALGLGLISLRGMSGHAKDMDRALSSFRTYEQEYKKRAAKSRNVDFELAKFDILHGDWDRARNRITMPLDPITISNTMSYLYPRVEMPYLLGAVRKHSFLNGKGNSCGDAVEKFKEAADRGDWNDPVYHRGTAAYARNDIPTALLSFAIAADAGVWEGQYNAADLLDQSTFPISPRQECAVPGSTPPDGQSCASVLVPCSTPQWHGDNDKERTSQVARMRRPAAFENTH